MTTTLSIRLDQNLKRDSQKVFKKLGMDISSATKIFLTQVVNTESIPFKIRTVNGFTPEFELDILEELKDIKDNPQNYKKYKSGKELVSDILGKEK
jgi:DNA-damage-inducible protein J